MKGFGNAWIRKANDKTLDWIVHVVHVHVTLLNFLLKMNILSSKHKSISLCHPYSVISAHQFKRIWLFSILSVVEWLWNDSLNQYHLTGINPLPRRKCFLPFVVELDTYLIWSRMFSLRHVDWFCGDVRLVYERRTCVVGWKSSSRFFHSKEMSKSSDLAIGKKSILQTHYNPKIV